MRFCGIACLILVLTISRTARPAGTDAPRLEPLVDILNRETDPAIQQDVLGGMLEALSDRRSAPMPKGWTEAYQKLEESNNPAVRQDATLLALLFGDPRAIESLHHVISDRRANIADRQKALASLVQTKDPGLVPLLDDLLDDSAMAGAALRALAAYPDDSTPLVIVKHYPHFTQSQKGDAIITLSSRPPSALVLLDAIAAGKMSKQDITAFNVRQMANLSDEKVDERLRQVWGPVRGPSRDKLALIAQYKAKFTPQVMSGANVSAGRATFARTCAVCHTLFDAGGQVGPNLTGAQRGNIDYVLGKVLDPSAVVSQNYRMTIIKTKDGRVINGIVQQETPTAVTLKAPNETLVVQTSEIEKRKISDLSLMPEGLLSTMSDEQIRDLLAYLAAPAQVSMPAATTASR